MFIEDGYSYEYLPREGITRETHEFFDVKTKIDAEGRPVSVAYPFTDETKQVRILNPVDPKRRFFSEGSMSEQGGWPVGRFSAGQSKAITITEGLDDAMAAYQMLGKYPVYAVRSASTAKRDVRQDYDYLNSFEKIYLALDDDEPGRKAAGEVASIFDINKVYHVKLAPYKDAKDYTKAGKVKEFQQVWWNATRFLPEGIVSSFEEIDGILDKADDNPGVAWPFPTLNALTDGLKLSKTYLFSGLEGTGKTEIFHAVEHCLIKDHPDANIGIIHMEEPLDENIKRLVGYELRQPCHFSDSVVSRDEIKKVYRSLALRPDRLHFYNHFGSDDPDVLLDKIRYLVAAAGCKYVFLDNITIVVTGRNPDDERRELDYLSTRLEMLVKELKFCLVMISHENDMEFTRGSRNISKVADVWINIKRDIQTENEFLRRVIHLTVKKGRGCRGTGPAGKLLYHPETGILSEWIEGELPTE